MSASLPGLQESELSRIHLRGIAGRGGDDYFRLAASVRHDISAIVLIMPCGITPIAGRRVGADQEAVVAVLLQHQIERESAVRTLPGLAHLQRRFRLAHDHRSKSASGTAIGPPLT